MREQLPELVIALATRVREAGGRALVVGGWVRDALVGHDSKDLDVEVFGLEAARLRAVLDTFGRVDAVGESFAVYKVGDLDVSLPRRESKTGRGHRGFEIHGDPFLPPREAARRRDFTINAIALDPLTGELVDPFNGRADLEARRLRVVDRSTFGDDSLRVLRAIQFTARFSLTVDDDTRALCRSIPLDDLPAERIWGEVEKLLLRAPHPSRGLALALDLDTVGRLWPPLAALPHCRQDPEWHPEGDVWTHTLMVVDEARQRIDDLDRGRAVAVMLGALLHDVGKPATTAMIDGRLRSPGHEEAGVEPAEDCLDRLGVHSIAGFDVRHTVLGIVAQHLKPLALSKAPAVGDGAYRRLAQKVDLELLARVAAADCHGRTGSFDCSGIDRFLERARSLGVQHAPPAPMVQGRHLLSLGMPPGPDMGALLKAIYEQQLDGRVRTLEDGLAVARDMLGRAARPTGHDREP